MFPSAVRNFTLLASMVDPRAHPVTVFSKYNIFIFDPGHRMINGAESPR